MHNIANDRSPRNTNTTAPTHIRVTMFQPFESRIGIDHVLRLDFNYDPQLIAHLKRILPVCKAQAVNPSLGRMAPGGWLQREQCWFVEPIIWGAVRRELEILGYRIDEVTL